MTTPEVRPEKQFVPTWLPWIISGTALLVYLSTINTWTSASSLETVARASGFAWQSEVTRPVYWLVTFPFKYLPASIVPLALNLLSAVMAAATLGLLARSIAILPHDRTEQQRIRQRNPDGILSINTAWIPPVFAAVVLGLQLTFWEGATAASSDALDVLLLAYSIRCLLEFRLNGRQSWMSRASLVFAAGMTNSWVFIALFPFFLVSMAWIKGISFFDWRFLLKMFVWGLAGLSFYLLLPIVNSLAEGSQSSVWQVLKQNLSAQKNIVVSLLKPQMLFNSDRPLWVLALPTLMPLLVIGIKWPAYFGDPSKLGMAVSDFFFHFFHGFLLLFCVYIALDPPMSPRSYGLSAPAYYLGAIGAGYIAGYFLLIFGRKPLGRPRPSAAFAPALNKAVLCATAILLAVAPAALIYRNLPQIRTTNGPALFAYASELHRALPSEGAIVLSDDLWKLWIAQSAAARLGEENKHVYVLAGSEGAGRPEALRWPGYHRFLRSQYGERWPVDIRDNPDNLIDTPVLIDLMNKLSGDTNVYYLHPSFGYYFELLYAETHGPVFRLKQYPPNTIEVPKPTQEELNRNLKFWNGEAKILDQTLLSSLAKSTETKRTTGGIESLFKKLGLTKRPNDTVMALATGRSRSLNAWGVELQRNARLEDAESAFERALQLNPKNGVAQLNLKSNFELRGKPDSLPEVKEIIKELSQRFRNNLDAVINENGPFDEAEICFDQGQILTRNRNFRQGLQMLSRAKELAPENLQVRILMASVYNMVQRPDDALKVVNGIEEDAAILGLNQTNRLGILPLQASAHLIKGEGEKAAAVVQAGLKGNPNDEGLLATASQVYMQLGRFAEALQLVERRLKTSPKNAQVLLDKGYLQLRLGKEDESIKAFNQVLDLAGNDKDDYYYGALLNRAIAYLRKKDYGDAKSDYMALLKDFPNSHVVHFGLGEIADSQGNPAAAIYHYEQYLKTAPANTQESSNVVSRVEKLKSESP